MFDRSFIAAIAASVLSVSLAAPALAQVAQPQLPPDSHLGEIERKQRAIAGLQMDIALTELEARKAESLAKRAKSLAEVDAGNAARAAVSRPSLPAPAAQIPAAPASPVAAVRSPAPPAQVESLPVRVVSVGGVGQGISAIVSLPGGGMTEVREKDALGNGWTVEQISLAGITVKHGPTGKRDKLAFTR